MVACDHKTASSSSLLTKGCYVYRLFGSIVSLDPVDEY